MVQTYSKSRQQAEIAFQRTQVPAEANAEAAHRIDDEADRLRAKTARLREARLNRDAPQTQAP
ncbi:hypothetical protein ACQKGC_00270 [Allorhizobium pseudoryzae]|jgi:hypothetical protein|uniref:hypothetical protein n=1 Tax=Allorhizobium pseudoryzae TaxID=379684 RepID=UPI0013ECB286|nr:hypothetical protein [Allorhizobium pseudoryzae]